jgi:hypothetical protein
MKHKTSSLLEVLGSRFNKENFMSHLNSDTIEFNNAIEIALKEHQPESWRAAWIINHSSIKNDERLQPRLKEFISVLLTKGDGHQREILKLLLKMEIPEDLEGVLFDKSVTIWEDISKSPSVRMIAFKVLVKIAAHYPEMKNEISFLVQDQYLDSLSPGIKNSMLREAKKLDKV